ncbi:hypothetical protein, partial [Deinococcus saxicola]|uniref:hypothetical protein n=1 Tax=Deinococcus saxicola TaxID=249406 RepID=UPI0039EFCA51
MERWIELNNKVLAGTLVQPQHDLEALQAYFQEKVLSTRQFQLPSSGAASRVESGEAIHLLKPQPDGNTLGRATG